MTPSQDAAGVVVELLFRDILDDWSGEDGDQSFEKCNNV